MAMAIKSVPTLTGKVAGRFVEKAIEASKRRGTVDYSKEMKICRSILSKAKLDYKSEFLK